jgi:hypothetical protein
MAYTPFLLVLSGPGGLPDLLAGRSQKVEADYTAGLDGDTQAGLIP